ncbi:MAG: TonB-dependent receptor, partial [Steroidobacteraceae bacterium]
MRMQIAQGFHCLTVVTACCGGLLAGAAWAADEPSTLEEVVVTAQKREQSIQDVGISMAAVSGQQLANLGISNTTEITQQVPGLQLTTFSPALTVFNLRGISQNNFQDNLEAPVAVYVDGAYVATMNAINGQLFDMDRVEVLRGPQGTLFGRNATGGLIHFLTHRATDKELNGYLELSGAQFNTKSAEGAIGGAFNDRLRGRLAARWEKSDGYMKPGTAFGVPATGGNAGGANGFAVRGSIQA